MLRNTKTKPLFLAFALLSTTLVVGVLANNNSEPGTSSNTEPNNSNPVTVLSPADIEVAMIRAGLDPEALAAAGVSSGAAATVVADFEEAMVAEATRLSTADADRAAAQVETDRLRRLVRSGRGSQEDVTNLATAKTDLATAEAAREATLDDWFEAGTDSLSTAQVATLGTIRDNRHWKLKIEYLVEDRTEAEWVQLREALANERISAKYGETADAACQSLILSCNADAAVAAAKVALDQNKAAVEAAWSSALE